jgi:hypothetical protein
MASEAVVEIATALYTFAQSTNQPWATTGFEVPNNFIVFKLFSSIDYSDKSLDS